MTMMVYHAVAPTFGVGAPAPFTNEHYTLVALVEGEDIEMAFRLTNHIDHSWTENEGVAAKVARPRSTSVGDVIVKVNDAGPGVARAFRCEMAGWKML